MQRFTMEGRYCCPPPACWYDADFLIQYLCALRFLLFGSLLEQLPGWRLSTFSSTLALEAEQL